MVTIQEMCEVGDLGGLRTALGVPEAAQGSGWGTTALLDLAAGNKLHPEANDRHQNGTKTEHTLVEIAATHGQLDVVKFLVEECRVDVDSVLHNERQSPLRLACEGGHLNVVEYLVTERAARMGHTAAKVILDYPDQVLKSCMKSCGQAGTIEVFKPLWALLGQSDDGGARAQHLTPTLIEACGAGHLEMVMFLVDECGADPALPASSGSPLLNACSGGHLHVVRFLVSERHVRVRTKRNPGTDYVCQAAESGNLNLIRFLVDVCDAVVSSSDRSKNPVRSACRHGHTAAVRMLANEYGVDVPTDALKFACLTASNSLGLVKVLISEFGCDPLATSGWESCLQCACIKGHFDVVRYLVKECHVPVNYIPTKEYNYSPIALACESGALDIVKYLTEDCTVTTSQRAGDDESSLVLIAANSNRESVVRYLATVCQADVQQVNKEGDTPLKAVIRNGNQNLFRFFVSECGLSMVAAGEERPTTTLCDALHAACEYGQLEIVAMLVGEFGADVEECDSNGNRAAYAAASNCHLDVLKYLRSNCKADLAPTSGQMPLFGAVSSFKGSDSADIVRYLVLEQKVAVNDDSDGCSALMAACNAGNMEAVKVLVTECGANVIVTNTEGETIVHAAARSGNSKILRFLFHTFKSRLKELLSMSDCPLSPLHTLTERFSLSGRQKTIECLVKDWGIPIDTVDPRTGETPFLRACSHLSFELIVNLVRHGANVKHCLKDGKGAWMCVDAAWKSENRFKLKFTGRNLLFLGTPFDHNLIMSLHSYKLRQFLFEAKALTELERAVKQRAHEFIPGILRSLPSDETWGTRSRLIQLLTSSSLDLWYEAVSVWDNQKTLEQIEQIAVPWSPKHFHLVHRGMREGVRTIVMVANRGRRHLPHLAFELWLHIMSFLRREHFPFQRD